MSGKKQKDSKDINAVLTQLVQDTRAPMKSIMEFLELALQDDLNDKTKGCLDSISNNINLLRNIIHDILVDNDYPGNLSDVYDIYKSIFTDEILLINDDISDKPVDEYIEDVNVIRDIFDKLEPMLKNHDLVCFSMVNDIRKIPGTEDIIEQIEQIEFEEAYRAFKKLKSELLN